ncbi:FecCD family ABC transporter permease [Neotabrizicola sp. VNH66]|uniref:FecCD family ABC transporter permease n=1 Tax=Neotabrizicola sp. VNH66 TaxID=3400918 RepID=UPI003C11167B
MATAGQEMRVPGRLVRDRTALMLALALLAGAVALLSLGTGAAGLSPLRLLSALTGGEALSARDRVVLFDIRLPRLVMGFLIGGALAVSGALMQGLFRNPLADPGITGVGAGAGLGAVLSIVLGGMLPASLAALAGPHLTAFAAFLGGWSSTLLLYRVATREGQTNVATMLLAGIALGALSGAVTGVLVYLADDKQLRDLTFWGMGSLAGATWPKIAVGAAMILPLLVLAPLLARGLNALSLGEAQALHVGLRVQRLKNLAILGTAAGAGISVALAGGIGFVGIVVPHLLRLVAGPDNRAILPAAALLGGTLLVAADMIARTIAAPAELPIGVIMALIGAPVFLWILLRQRGLAGF